MIIYSKNFKHFFLNFILIIISTFTGISIFNKINKNSKINNRIIVRHNFKGNNNSSVSNYVENLWSVSEYVSNIQTKQNSYIIWNQ